MRRTISLLLAVLLCVSLLFTAVPSAAMAADASDEIEPALLKKPVISEELAERMETMEDGERICVTIDGRGPVSPLIVPEIEEESGLTTQSINAAIEAGTTFEVFHAYHTAKQTVLRRLYGAYNSEFLDTYLADLPSECLHYVSDTHCTIYASLTKEEILRLADAEPVTWLGYLAPEELAAALAKSVMTEKLAKRMETMDDAERIDVAISGEDLGISLVDAMIAEESSLSAQTIEAVLGARGTSADWNTYRSAKTAVLRRLYGAFNSEILETYLPGLPSECIHYVADTHCSIIASLTKEEILRLADAEQVTDLDYLAPEEQIAVPDGMDDDLQLRADFLEKLRNDHPGPEPFPEDATVDDVRIANTIGTFNGAWIGSMSFQYEGSAEPAAFSLVVDVIDGVLIRHYQPASDDYVWAVVYVDGEFYTLQEAVDAGILTHEDILKVRDACEGIDRWVNPYKDVSPEAWYYRGVCLSTMNKLMNGVASDTFAPDQNMTRAMLLTVLWRMCGEKATDTPSTFRDVSADAWYAKAVAWGEQTGIVKGVGEGLFAPNDTVTREQAVTMLCRALRTKWFLYTPEEKTPLDSFRDADTVSDWAEESFRWALDHALLCGVAGENGVSLLPQKNMTRAELAEVLARLVTTMV